jgi:glycogen synthase
MAQSVGRVFRVLMLSWEYPPAVVGGLGRHVAALATALTAAGHDITVVTRDAPGAPAEERLDGVRVVRVPAGQSLPDPTTADGVTAWTRATAHTLTGNALAALGGERYDVVHGHDWLVAHTAATLAAGLGGGLVATIHATEAGRPDRGLPRAVDTAVHAAELHLVRQARRIVVCSRYMRREVIDLLGLYPDQVAVVPDGVDPPLWQASAREIAAARLRFAGVGPLLGYAGRLVPEKGVSDLLAALPRLRQRNPGLRAVIAGDGPSRCQLRRQARLLKLERAVSFTGFLDQPELAAVLAATDAVVVPSRYEPSGMIALEAAAAGAPLAVASTGGLTEIVEPGSSGVTFPPGDPDGLAEAVDQLLAEPSFARRLADRARQRVAGGYTWAAAAARTLDVYASALDGRAPDFVPVELQLTRERR